MVRRFLILTSLFIAAFIVADAQNVQSVRINELLVFNQTNYEDDYGNREAWVELYNAGHSSVNVGGCYLTVKRDDKSMTYRIPTTDSRTIIPPLGYMIFFCEGTYTKGTFHTNFTLDKTGYLAFLDAGGNLIDEVKYNVDAQKADVSIGLTKDADENIVFKALEKTTPMSTNELEEEVPQYEKFRQRDPSGFIMTITAMGVVFSALVVLYVFFRLLGKSMVRIAARKERESKGETVEPTQKVAKAPSYSGEEVAAIALAVQLYQEDLHDKESTILTINRVARAYSPWSSKIYGLRQLPHKK